MSIFEASRTLWTSRMLSIFRIVAGLILLSMGTAAVFGFPPGPGPQPAFDPMSIAGAVGALEVVGGLAIVAGLYTRPTAMVLAVLMAMIYLRVSLPKSVFPTVNLGMPALLFAFFFLYLTFSGAGAWSVDAVLAIKKIRERLPKRVREAPPNPVPHGSRPMLYRG